MGYAIGDHAVHADGGEQQRGRGEGADERRCQATLRDGTGDRALERHEAALQVVARHGNPRLDVHDRPAKRGNLTTWILDVGDESDPRPNLDRPRHEDLRRRTILNRLLPNVFDDADDGAGYRLAEIASQLRRAA